MSGIAINPNPTMSRFLLESTSHFQADPLVIVDVGARDGFNAEWRVFGECARIYCFEPDARECARLNAASPPNVTYLPTALGREPKQARIYETRLPYSSGLYASRMEFFARLLNRDNAEVVGDRSVELDTLDRAMAERNVHAVNFIKLDAEGAELEILMGGRGVVSNPKLLGILTEIRFHPEINDSPPFWQTEQQLQEDGFRLFDLSTNPQSRIALPYPGHADYFMPDGRRFYAYTTHGQIMDGDALYFRDVLIAKNLEIRKQLHGVDLLKLAAFFELYHHNDSAAEVILTFREQLEPLVDCDKLLDLLTPRLLGRKLSYADYLQTYFDPRTSFSSPGPKRRVLPIARRIRNLMRALGAGG